MEIVAAPRRWTAEPVAMSHIGPALPGGHTLCLTLARGRPIMGTLHRPPRERT